MQGSNYEFKVDNDTYALTIQLNSTDKILFTLKKMNDIQSIYYKKELQYEELLNIFELKKEKFVNTEELLKFIDKAKKKNIIKIILEKDRAKFILTKPVDLDEIECIFYLEKAKLAGQELNESILKDIQEIKEKIKLSDEEIIGLKKENNELKEEIKILKEKQSVIELNNINKNEIIILVKVDKDEDINKKINFLNDTQNNNIKELNEENVELYINKKKQDKFSNYFIPKSRGAYKIKLVFNIFLKIAVLCLLIAKI